MTARGDSHLFEKANRELPVPLEARMTSPQVVPIFILPEGLPRGLPLCPVTPSNHPGHVCRTVGGGLRIGSKELTFLAAVHPEARHVPSVPQPWSGLRRPQPIVIQAIRVVVVVADLDQRHRKTVGIDRIVVNGQANRQTSTRAAGQLCGGQQHRSDLTVLAATRPAMLEAVAERIHDDEPDTSEPVVRMLLTAECPQWSASPIEYLKTSGTDNAMWRVHLGDQPDVVVRLPRRPGAAAGVEREVTVLRQVERSRLRSIVATPSVRHVGRPQEGFPYRWSVLEWIDGSDAWTERADLAGRSLESLAHDLARSVGAIGEVTGVDAPLRPPGSRGGPLGPLLERLDDWLENPEWNAAHLIDVDAIRRLAAEALEVADERFVERFVHGDLIPGNLLVERGRLAAIIDWGGAGRGDAAQDLAPAWAVLTAAERSAFREMLAIDDAAWLRGRTFELEHAVGGVLYYVPRRHPLGDVMTRTLERILGNE